VVGVVVVTVRVVVWVVDDVEVVEVVGVVEEVVVVVVAGAVYSKVIVPLARCESTAAMTYVPVTHNGEPPTDVV
jgi:hypothetical protein